MEPKKNDHKYLRAKQRVAKLKKFYSGLMFYVLFIIAMAGLNYYTNQWRYPWFLWAVLGWGIGIIFQASEVFGWSSLFGKNWEERKLKEYMDEERRRVDNERFKK